MPVKRQDAHRALELLEEYHSRLTKPQDRPLRNAIERVIRIFKGQLFKALLDIQEYYEMTLLNDTKSTQEKMQETNEIVSKWEADPPIISNQTTASMDHYGYSGMTEEEPLPPPPPPEVIYQTVQKVPEPKTSTQVTKTTAVTKTIQQNSQQIETNGVSEESWEFEEISLERGATGLGFSIAGGSDIPHVANDPSIYITKLIDGGAAVADGRLRMNDIILSVNGVSTVNVTHVQSVDALKKAGKTVHLVVKRHHDPNEEVIQQIDLVKGNQGLGFSIAGGLGNQHVAGDNGIFITKIIEGGAAYQDGRLAVGDRLVAVNDVNLENVTHEEAVAALKATKEHVRLIIAKPKSSFSIVDGPSVHITKQMTGAAPGAGRDLTTDSRSSPNVPQKMTKSKSYASANATTPNKDKMSKSPRKIILRKGPTGLGFNIVGGEDGEGIFVSFILAGGPADLSGELHKGDQLISVNGIDIREATHEQAAAALKGAGDTVEIIAQHRPDEYSRFEAKINDLREQMLNASAVTVAKPKHQKKKGLYVRALFDYDPALDSDLPGRGISFRFGDVLHVTNSNDDDWWQAQKILPEEDLIGCIPSKQRVELKERARRTKVEESKKKKKKTKKSKSGDESSEDGGIDVLPILSYETVIQKEMTYIRPVILLGPLKDRFNDDLISEYPDAFGSCIPHTTRQQREHEVDGRDYHFVASREQMELDIENHLFIEAGQFSDNLYGTSVQSVKDVAQEGKHCILDVSGSAIQRLQAAGLYPITVFIKPQSVDNILQWNNNKANEEQALKTYEKTLKLEEEFGELFTAVVCGITLDDVYSEVKRVIDEQSGPVLWIAEKAADQ